jgi:hypothetical protein
MGRIWFVPRSSPEFVPSLSHYNGSRKPPFFANWCKEPHCVTDAAKISFRVAISLLQWWIKRSVSSVYSDTFIPMDLGATGCSKFFSIARCRIFFWKGSIARIKDIGERGSPCRKPLSCLIGCPSNLFRRIIDDKVDSTILIYYLHLGPKPSLSIRSSKYSQEMESKAFAMSNLRKRAGIFFLCISLIKLWTKAKLSSFYAPL